MTSGTSLPTATVLATARRLRVEANRAEAGILQAAVEWAGMHPVDDLDLCATWGNTPVPLTGEGVPMTSSRAVAEFATVLGLSRVGGEHFMAETLELAHRLPKLWARVQSGSLPHWRGRRIAAETLHLSPEAAAHVDTEVASLAHKSSEAQTQRLIEAAIAEHMPALAQQILDASAEARNVTFDHRQVSFAGTSRLFAELDMLDALQLEDVVTAEAQRLADQGCAESLDIRRAMALGNLARGELTTPSKHLTVYLHLGANTEQGSIENAGPRLLTKTQIATWCGAPESRITIRPVLDLSQTLATSAYEIPDGIREHVILRDRTCVFPHCTRNARSCDIDHITAYDDGGPTSTTNLAALCRAHHNLKTHHGWTYTTHQPGTYHWQSPHGYQWTRDRGGTEMTTPPLISPPAPVPV